MANNLTDSLDEVNQYIVDLMRASKDSLGLVDVWYGEYSAIPHTPSLAVDPRNKSRTVTETGHMCRNDFSVVLTLFHSRLSGPQVVMKECLTFAEKVEDALNADRKLGDLLIYSYVERVETGYATRNKTLLKAAQISWTGFSKTRLL